MHGEGSSFRGRTPKQLMMGSMQGTAFGPAGLAVHAFSQGHAGVVHAVGMMHGQGLTVRRHRMDKKAWAIEKEAIKLKKTVRDWPVDLVSRP